MPFSSETKSKLRNTLADYEGYIKHLYLDTKGKVTVGVGHMIPNKNAMSGVTMYKVQNDKLSQPASLQEKMDEYEKISQMSFGVNLSDRFFKKNTSLTMKDIDVDFLTNQHIDKFYSELKSIYTRDKGYPDNFDDLHKNVQLALFDMAFNMGTPTLKNNFPKFNTALKASNYKTAAKESHRKDIAEERNDYVKDLLLDLITEVEL